MAKKFQTLGVMLDMSRNAVMSLPALKRYLPILRKMGYNTLFLYTEDTYEVNDEPYFGYMRGRYSKEEMKELDAFANSIGMEVVPCIQTLAHLNATMRWNKIPRDCSDILLCEDERTYELIDRMFATLHECFATKRLHVGMDEAHMLGRGKYLDLHGYVPSPVIIKRHLEKVCEIAAKYGYEVMVWSDMFFRSWCNGDYYLNEVKEFPKEVVDAIPEQVIPVYWDYYHDLESEYDIMFQNHKQLSKHVWFAGGVWSWSGFMPHNEVSLHRMLPAIRSCRTNGVRNIMMTMWGDNGAECSRYSMLPSLFYIAEYAKGNEDDALIKAKFQRLTGLSFDDFMKLDNPNNIFDRDADTIANPCKFMLYCDYFNDYLDYMTVEGASATYARHAEELYAIAKKSRKYGYLFTTAARLCDVLKYKYELGIKTRRAYEAGDKETLRTLAEVDYKETEKALRQFHAVFEKQWAAENKTSGFEVQDARLGAMIQRTISCRKRILDYVNGKIDAIEELEEKLLPFGKEGTPMNYNYAIGAMSTNIM